MSDKNTGNCNTGDWNTGNWNTGNCNTGNWNTGYKNTGYKNTGDWNTGYKNTGNKNTGDWNTGYKNTGNKNTGDWNTGNWNTGNCNTGNWNTGNCNTGNFCTNTPNAVFFDQPTNLTYEEAQELIPEIDLPVGAEWVPTGEMSDDEKRDNVNHEHIGGFLRKHELPYTESFPVAWAKMSEEERAKWTSLPNFDAEKFLHITGVDVRRPKHRTITIDGKEIRLSEESFQSLKEQLGSSE